VKKILLHSTILALLLLNNPAFSDSHIAPGNIASGKVLTHGSWTTTNIELNDELMAFAKTTNTDGSTLGFLCTSKTAECLPYISIQLGCNADTKYPMLISLPEGIYAELLLCEKLSGSYIYNIPSSYLNSLLEANKVGFAYGTASGKFKASYFSLDGSAKALISAKKMIRSFGAKKPKRKSKPNEIYL
jgi:hypothetical protein